MKAAIYGTWAGSLLTVATALWLGYPWWGLLVLIPLALTLYATFSTTCDWWGETLRTFGSRYREVLITFDGAPDPDETPEVLVLLERYRARGMFMVDVERVRRCPDLVKEIVQRGHGVGCALPEPLASRIWRMSPAALEAALTEVKKELADLLPGYELTYFRSTHGVKAPWLHPVLDKLGMKLMGHSACDGGLLTSDIEKTLLQLRRDVGKGGVILFHHNQRDPQGHGVMTEVLEEMLIWLRGQGYTMGE